MAGEAVAARGQKHRSLVVAHLRGLAALRGIADLSRAGPEVHVGGHEAARSSLTGEGAVDAAGDLQVRRQERLEQGERQIGDRPRGIPRAGLLPAPLGAEAGVAGGPAEALQRGAGGARDQNGGPGERPGARLLVGQVEPPDLALPAREIGQPAGQREVERPFRSLHGQGDLVRPPRSPAVEGDGLEPALAEANVGGVEVDQHRSVAGQVDVRHQRHGRGVVGPEDDRLAVRLRPDPRALPPALEVALGENGAAGVRQGFAQVRRVEPPIEVPRIRGKSAGGGEPRRARAQVEPGKPIAASRQLQAHRAGEGIAAQVAAEIGELHPAVGTGVAQHAVAAGREGELAGPLGPLRAGIDPVAAQLHPPGDARLPGDRAGRNDPPAEHVPPERADVHPLLVAPSGEDPAARRNVRPGEMGVHVDPVVGEAAADLRLAGAAHHHRRAALERPGQPAPLRDQVEIEILGTRAHAAAGVDRGAVLGAQVQVLEEEVLAAPRQPVGGLARAVVFVGAGDLALGDEIVEPALDLDVPAGDPGERPLGVDLPGLEVPHLGREIHPQLAHGREDAALDGGGEGLGEPRLDPEILQRAAEGAGADERRQLGIVIGGLGAEVDRIVPDRVQIALGPQLEGGTVHPQAAHVEDVPQALAAGVERDHVDAERRLAGPDDLDVADQRVAHDQIDRQMDVHQAAVLRLVLLRRGKDDPDALGIEPFHVELPAAELARMPCQLHAAHPHVHGVRPVAHVAQLQRPDERPPLEAHRQLARQHGTEAGEDHPRAALGGDAVPAQPCQQRDQDEERQQEEGGPAQEPAALARWRGRRLAGSGVRGRSFRVHGVVPFEALTPPAPLSQRERGEKDKGMHASSFFPPLPLGEEG